MFMKYKNIFCSIFFTFLMTAFGSVFAEDTGNTQEMDMEQMKEFLKGTGMSEDQIKQMEGIMGDAAGKQVEHDAAILEKEQQEFEAAYGNNPNALIEMNEYSYTLKVTECKIHDDGWVKILAKEAPKIAGKEGANLWLGCCGGFNNFASRGLTFASSDTSDFVEAKPSNPQFDGTTYKWEGVLKQDVLWKGATEVNMKINLSCEGLF